MCKYLVDKLEYRFELLQALSGWYREDHDEGVALGDGEPLHGGELVAARRVRDLHRAHRVVAADHLPDTSRYMYYVDM